MLTGAGPLAAVIPVALAVFIVAAFVLRHDPARVRAFYAFLVVFVSILVALSALGGVARAIGMAIADPKTTLGACGQIRLETSRADLAQGPPEPPQAPQPPAFTLPPSVTFPPELRERIPIPSFDIVTPPPIRGVPAEPGRFDCPTSSGRDAAGGQAARSGALLLAALGIAWPHTRHARVQLNEED